MSNIILQFVVIARKIGSAHVHVLMNVDDGAAADSIAVSRPLSV